MGREFRALMLSVVIVRTVVTPVKEDRNQMHNQWWEERVSRSHSFLSLGATFIVVCIHYKVLENSAIWLYVAG